MAAKTFLPGQKITISYTSKGYALNIAYIKSGKAIVKTKYYSNLDLLLNSKELEITTYASNGVSKPLVHMSTRKNKSIPKDGSDYYDSVRPYKENVILSAELPEYKNAYFEFVNMNTAQVKVVGFVVSPSSISHSYSGSQQMNKTMGGWYIMRTGKNPQAITLTGYMLDTMECQERHDFVEKYYRNYIEDKKNANNEYTNEWLVNLIVEGKKYVGFFQSMNIQKSAVQPFLYQYNMTYLSFDEIMIYQSSRASKNRKSNAVPKYTQYNASGSKSTKMIGGTTGELLGIS